MSKKTSIGLEENIAGLLCYVLGWITGLVFYLLEKENKFVKYHALQSMILFGGLFAINIVIGILMSVFAVIHLGILIPLFVLLNTIVGIVSLILWIILMVKAAQGEKFKLPLVSDIAESYL